MQWGKTPKSLLVLFPPCTFFCRPKNDDNQLTIDILNCIVKTYWSPRYCWAPPVNPYLSTSFSPDVSVPSESSVTASEPNDRVLPLLVSCSALPWNSSSSSSLSGFAI